ncbi:MAG: PepSY domain-containing protein [Gemmatirosa sp.]|nr:PepSY domain-containing protein [Gemmatirosa sp.]
MSATMPNESTAAERAPSARSVASWRRWHRWIGFPAAIFLLFSAVTGFFVAGTEFFGEDEALRERLRTVTSPVTVDAPATAWTEPLGRALRAVAAQAPGAPVDRVVLQLKGDAPTIAVFTGKRGGGEDRQFVVDARSGVVLRVEAYADKPFLYRLHSGEAFGDGGLVVSMGWALALVAMTCTGLVIWWRIRRRDATGVRRVFW